MPKFLASARPDKKLTDFFSKKPKTGPRPGQPIYDVSSSSELQSIVSISSDDGSVTVVASKSGQRTRGHDGIRASPRLRGDTQARGTAHSKISVSSKLSETHTAPISASPQVSKPSAPRGASGATPQCSPVVPSTPKKTTKKRKHQTINLISSEESDGPVYPSIHVRLSPKKYERESTTSAPDKATTVAPIVPLTPRQNLLSHSKCSPNKELDVAKPSVQMMSGNSPIPTHCQPSPSKRARCESILFDRIRPSGPGFDADDESESQVGATHKNLGRRVSPPVHFAQQFEANDEGFMHEQQFQANAAGFMNDEMQVDLPFFSLASNADAVDGVQPVDEQKNESDALIHQLGCAEKHEIVPSSQANETELLMDCASMAIDDLNTSEPSLRPALPTVSPSKARTEDIIARIRAKAEADAAAQVENDRKRSSLGLLGSESDLSSLSSLSNDEDERELELELNTFAKPNNAPSTSTKVRSPTSPKPGTRRSARHLDGPAPNYAKKLELFREDTPPPLRKANTLKTKPEACPLDKLLKDRQREWMRKARIETRRKGDFSGVLGADMIGPSVFETPKRGDTLNAKTESPGSCSSSPCDDDSFQDVMMDTATREELLGKEGSEAVGKILDDDRKQKRVVDQEHVSVSFWRDNVEGNDVVPQFMTTDQSHPFLTALANAIKREEYKLASLLVDSGAFASVPFSIELLDWLFSTALSANPDLSLSAYRALIVLHRDDYITEVMSRAQLGATKLLSELFKLGVNAHVARLLGNDEETQVPTVAMSQQAKWERVFRFLTMLEALGRSQNVDPMAIPSLVSALLLLCLDPSAVPELQQDVVSAIEAVLAGPNVTRNIELDTCKLVLHVTKELGFHADLRVRMLALLPGCGPSSGRVRRWTAWAMLGGDLQGCQECADVPPIQTLVNLFYKSSPGDVKFEVTPDTNYEELSAQVNILSVAMTELFEYVRLGNGGAMVNALCEALDQINGKIVDTRAAHMDRTKAKEDINRLQKRLVYQRHATLERMRPNTGKMEQFLIPRSRLHRGHN